MRDEEARETGVLVKSSEHACRGPEVVLWGTDKRGLSRWCNVKKTRKGMRF